MGVPDYYIQNLLKRMKQTNLSLSDKVVEAFRNIPRHYFVDVDNRTAYKDMPLPIGSGQTISAPHMYAMMLSQELCDPKKGMDILEIGTGSGYGASLLAYVVKPGLVITVERHISLANSAKEAISKLGLNNVKVIHGDGTSVETNQQYDRIFVTAAGPKVPDSLLTQLKSDGRMIIPLEENTEQWLSVVTIKNGNPIINKKFRVRFVPLIGKEGFES